MACCLCLLGKLVAEAIHSDKDADTCSTARCQHQAHQQACATPKSVTPDRLCAWQVVEEAEEEVEEVAETAAKPFASLFGGRPRQAAAEAEAEVEEVAETAAKPFASFFGGRPRQAAAQAEEEVEEVAQTAAKPFASLFGGRPRQAAAQAEDAAKDAGKRVRTLWGRKPKQAQEQVCSCARLLALPLRHARIALHACGLTGGIWGFPSERCSSELLRATQQELKVLLSSLSAGCGDPCTHSMPDTPAAG